MVRPSGPASVTPADGPALLSVEAVGDGLGHYTLVPPAAGEAAKSGWARKQGSRRGRDGRTDRAAAVRGRASSGGRAPQGAAGGRAGRGPGVRTTGEVAEDDPQAVRPAGVRQGREDSAEVAVAGRTGGQSEPLPLPRPGRGAARRTGPPRTRAASPLVNRQPASWAARTAAPNSKRTRRRTSPLCVRNEVAGGDGVRGQVGEDEPLAAERDTDR